MPRVSEQHLAARRRQILDAAARCFIANGFHQTSMQDVIRAAGLSVGAFYRYFPSKTDLIRAIAEETVGDLLAELDATVQGGPPPRLDEAMWHVLNIAEKRITGDQRARLAVQVWAEALRDPELAELVADIYQRVRDRFALLATRARDDGQLAAGTDPEAVGAVLFGLVQGYLLQRLLVGKIDASTYHAGIAALLNPGA
jgi:AcrR family transcriptional regulator